MADIDTKKKMAEALKKLLEKKPINKITVSEITEACDINRQSFYYHFPDVYFLAGFLFKNDLAEILGQWLIANNWQQAFIAVFTYAKANKAVILNTITSVDRDILKTNVYIEIEELIHPVIKSREKALNVSLNESDEKIIGDFYKYPLVGYTWDWIRNGMIEDPMPEVENIITLMTPNLDRNIMDMKRKESKKED